MELLSLKILRDSGLTLDWQTVCVGWRGFPLYPYYDDERLPSEEARDFAYESLEYAVDSEYQQALVNLIDANTNGGFSDVMARYGEALAELSGIPRELAVRKWRYATLQECMNETLSHVSAYGEYHSYASVGYCAYILVRQWNVTLSADAVPEVEPGYLDKAAFLLGSEALRSWLSQEKQLLTELGQMAEPSAPLV